MHESIGKHDVEKKMLKDKRKAKWRATQEMNDMLVS